MRWGSWRDDYPVFHPIGVMELAPARGGLVPTASGGVWARARAPFWSLTIIAMDVVALYGLCAYGSRTNLAAA